VRIEVRISFYNPARIQQSWKRYVLSFFLKRNSSIIAQS
jgi:hypothetical protein